MSPYHTTMLINTKKHIVVYVRHSYWFELDVLADGLRFGMHVN